MWRREGEWRIEKRKRESKEMLMMRGEGADERKGEKRCKTRK